MLTPILTPRDVAERYHRFMPDEIRRYLKSRGIPATLIDRQLLGWNGERITIPIFGPAQGEVLGFRYAKSPDDASRSPAMISEPESKPELYGWETLARQPYRVVICEGEFDRLVLEARGFPAVTSTGGAGVFLEEWVRHFAGIRHVFICFSRGLTSDKSAAKVQQVVPSARIARLPADLGEGGTIADFFIGRTQLDFEVVLASTAATADHQADLSPDVRELRPVDRALRRRAGEVRAHVSLHEIAGRYTPLQATDGRLVGHCPLHDDNTRAFAVYPKTNTYRCGTCGAEGDVVTFLMDKESITFGQAVEALEAYRFTHDLNGTS